MCAKFVPFFTFSCGPAAVRRRARDDQIRPGDQAYDTQTTGEATIRLHAGPEACAKCGACGGSGTGNRSIRLKTDRSLPCWQLGEGGAARRAFSPCRGAGLRASRWHCFWLGLLLGYRWLGGRRRGDSDTGFWGLRWAWLLSPPRMDRALAGSRPNGRPAYLPPSTRIVPAVDALGCSWPGDGL